MKEYRAATGGRFTYNEDFINLQDLALAFAEMFSECDNFIISGCKPSGSSISEGYVYINGKIRKFAGTSSAAQWPQYIYEYNFSESTTYASGGTKVARTVYSCRCASQLPSDNDQVTNAAPQFISVQQTGGLTINDAFFGKYAVLKSPAATNQSIIGNTSVSGTVSAANINATSGYKLRSGANEANVKYEGANLVVSHAGMAGRYTFSIEPGAGFRFYVNERLCLSVDDRAGISFSKPVAGEKAVFGGVAITENSIYQNSAGSASTLSVNMVGYSGGTSHFRNLEVGNGKGSAIVSINGANNVVGVNAPVSIVPSAACAISLRASSPSSSRTLQNYVNWFDSLGQSMAKLGFASTLDNAFHVTNTVGNVKITGTEAVDLGPAIKENGTLLSSKYVTAASLSASWPTKANVSDVYSKTAADAKFGIASNGFSQFVNAVGADSLRSQIGAAGNADFNACAKLGSYLADMASDEAKKALVRQNIGAPAANECQPLLNDSYWTRVPGTTGLFIRQIGHIVCIQGYLKLPQHKANSTVFTIPNSIDAPTHAVTVTLAFANDKSYVCAIAANSRNCVVQYCSGSCDRETNFSLTYMV